MVLFFGANHLWHPWFSLCKKRYLEFTQTSQSYTLVLTSKSEIGTVTGRR
jgi:hypothetical protein